MEGFGFRHVTCALNLKENFQKNSFILKHFSLFSFIAVVLSVLRVYMKYTQVSRWKIIFLNIISIGNWKNKKKKNSAKKKQQTNKSCCSFSGRSPSAFTPNTCDQRFADVGSNYGYGYYTTDKEGQSSLNKT